MGSGLVNLISCLVLTVLPSFLTRCISIKTSTQLGSQPIFVINLTRESWCWLHLLFCWELAHVMRKILHVCGSLRLKTWTSQACRSFWSAHILSRSGLLHACHGVGFFFQQFWWSAICEVNWLVEERLHHINLLGKTTLVFYSPFIVWSFTLV